MLKKLLLNKVEIALQESTTLSSENEKRYVSMSKDFESGKNVNSATSVDDLLSKINEN